MQLQGSAQLQTLLAMYDQETDRNRVLPSNQRLKIMVRRHFARNESFETVLVKSHKGKSLLTGKWNAVSGKQVDSVQKESLAVSATDPIVVRKHNCSFVLHKRGHRQLKETFQLGCVSPGDPRRKSVLLEVGKLGSKHAVKFSKGT